MTQVEEDWSRAQQDYYEAMKKEPRASNERKAGLRREILEPKQNTLEEYHRNFQLRQRPLDVAVPATAVPSAPPAPAGQPPEAPQNAQEPAPDPVTVVEFGKTPSPSPQPSTKFSIEEVGSGESAVDFKSKAKKRKK